MIEEDIKIRLQRRLEAEREEYWLVNYCPPPPDPAIVVVLETLRMFSERGVVKP